MELWGVIFGGIGGIAGVIAILYAHIAYRGSKASGMAATDANTLARESNETAKEAKRLAEEANEISHRFEQREIERHDVYWEGDWQQAGVYVLVKRGNDEAHDVVATVTADGEDQTKRADLITDEGSALVFEFPGIAQEIRREAGEHRRQDAADAASPYPGLISSWVTPYYHAGSERVQWSTKRGTPKVHEQDRKLESFEQFY